MIKKDKDYAKLYKTYIKTSAVGLEFGLSMGLCLLGGYIIDKKFNTYPYGIIIGAVIGSLAAIKVLWQFSKNYLRDHDKQNKN